MAIEAIAANAAAAIGKAVGGGGGATAGRVMELGPSQPVEPIKNARFDAAMDRMQGTNPVAPTQDMPPAVKGLFRALDGINGQARSVSDYAIQAEASGGQLTPGEIVQLTMKCQEFMFQCQLTSNIANRSSDGVQQLFKQQG